MIVFKKKIAFFVSGVNAGGIENYLLRFITYYKEQIDATVYCKSGKTGDLEEEYLAVGAKLVKFKIGYYNPKDWIKLKSELQQQKYDAIVDFTGNFSAIPLLVSKLVDISKRIVWYRNAADKFSKSPLKNVYNKLINRITRESATDVLSNSKAAFQYFYKDYNWSNDSRFEVIYNGLDAETFLSTSEDLRTEFSIPSHAFVVGNVGRLNEQKNHKTAMQVAIDLCSANQDIYFIFCGKGVNIEYQSLVDQHNLSKQIILTGVRRDVIKVLNTLDCFYFPSLLEGQPNALIEALVVGVPFVSSNIDPVKETIPESLHPYLLPPLDVEKAKLSILKVKDNMEYRAKFLIKDWAVESFNSEIQFDKFYKKIVNN